MVCATGAGRGIHSIWPNRRRVDIKIDRLEIATGNNRAAGRHDWCPLVALLQSLSGGFGALTVLAGLCTRAHECSLAISRGYNFRGHRADTDEHSQQGGSGSLKPWTL